MEPKEKKWKILESKYIIKRPWLTARCDKVELADGRVNDEYYVLEYPDWVNVIAITKPNFNASKKNQLIFELFLSQNC